MTHVTPAVTSDAEILLHNFNVDPSTQPTNFVVQHQPIRTSKGGLGSKVQTGFVKHTKVTNWL
jgi:hypothetical protein